MKYISIFFTILLIWVAVIIIAAFGADNWDNPVRETMTLYLMTLVTTLALFLIGFGKK